MLISPLGRVEGDLNLRIKITDGVVTNAWIEASMFRGFEIILKGKDPQAGLIVTPRICGICGGSHLYKAAYALVTANSDDVCRRGSPGMRHMCAQRIHCVHRTVQLLARQL